MSLPPEYCIEHFLDHAPGLDRAWKAGLTLNDEITSRVLPFIDPRNNPDRTGVLGLWLVHHQPTRTDVGLALVCPPEGCEVPRPVVNLYVHPPHRNRGLAHALLQQALQAHPDAGGFYTIDSVNLYRKHCLPCVFPAPRDGDGQPLSMEALAPQLGGDGLTATQRQHVQYILEDRAEYDRIEQEYRARRPRC